MISKRSASLGSFLLLASSVLHSGCAALHSKSEAEAPNGPNGIEDLTASDSDSQFETIVLFSTGNIQGALLSPSPNVGGAALLESYYKVAERDFGARLLWLDAGNLHGRPLEYEFDQGQSFSTFVSRSGMSLTLDDLDKDHPSPSLFQAGRIKVGVVSARDSNQLKHQAEQAISQGAQFVVWLTDLPIQCNPHSGNHAALVRRPGESAGFCEGILNDILVGLPEGLISAVIGSGNARPVQRFIYARYSSNPLAGIPVVEASPFAKDVHLIYLTYDLKGRKPVFAKTRIEGPVDIVPSQFHGTSTTPDSEVVELAEPSQSWLEEQSKTRLAHSSQDLSANPQGESGLADLVADAIREETGSNFAIVHPGMIKHAIEGNTLHAGDISRVDLSRVMPADSEIKVVLVNGEELKTLVRISENGSRGFSAVSGMRLKLIRPDRDAPLMDLPGLKISHVPSLWEQNRLIEMTDLENNPVSAKKTYRLAVPAYLIQGGDDWHWASQHFALAQRTASSGSPLFPSTRDLVAAYLKKAGAIDGVPTRISFENPPGHGKKSARRRKHKHTP